MTDLSRKLDIEPIAEPEWRRIEQALFDKLDDEPIVGTPPAVVAAGRRAPWRAAVALASVGAAAAVVAVVLARGSSPEPSSVHTSRVVTNEASSHVEFGGVALDVAPESALVVNGSDETGVLVVLETGAVTCHVEPRGDRPPVAVQAGDVRVEVVGTIFTVQRNGDTAQVAVTKGVVRVVRAGAVALVRAGEHWPAEDASSASEGSAPDAPVVFSAEETEPFSSSRPRGRALQGKAETGHGRPPAAAAHELTYKERYKEAERLEASDPEAAIAVYAEVAEGEGPWAANALFAQGRLELERGRTEVAAQLLRRYVRRYPNGANRRDATELLESVRHQ